MVTKAGAEQLESVSADSLRRLFSALNCAVKELGPHTPLRQLMTLILIALANKGNAPIGVRDIDKQLGELPSGTASKLLKSMMHVETERKPGVADTVHSERDPTDLRKWHLHLTAKGSDALSKIITCLEPPRQA